MWAAAANTAALMALEQTTGMTLSDPSDPLGSMNALLAAARSQTSTLTRPPMSRSRRRPSSSKSAVGATALANGEALMAATQAAGASLSSPDPSDPRLPQRSRRRPSSSKSTVGATGLANREVLMAAAQAAGVSLSSLDPSDPLCSKNNLLEDAQAQVSTLTRPQRSRSRPFSKSSTVRAAALDNHEAKQGQLQIPPWAKGLLDLIPPPIKRAKRAPSKVQEKASTTSYDLDCGEGKGYQNSKHNFIFLIIHFL